MTIGTNGVDSAANASNATNSITGNGDMTQLFTRLLIAQIKNQNPLEPTDPAQFVSQLTQLSQVESMQQLVAQTNASASMLQSMQVMALGAQVGSDVTAVTDQVVIGESVVHGRFGLESANSTVTVVLEDSAGQQSRIQLGTHKPGEVTFKIDPESLGLEPGKYSIRVETSAKETPAVEVQGTLQSVRISATHGAVLQVSNLGSIGASAITAFNGRPQ
ncbi:flagellar hook capping FlgD N-terminal domain-containing protein [Steroidobacter cummioxidans]|uniref:flagellar hook capping FlgD N-terminal domain-containing protein n=1 Tax=Steroidobacter cummioxidans TaxID=1803913 RepID=UPI000E32194B|nr:flagellar hook capping FlgD N-terminal domain-containing protein [Steroidobacter cummioxidans]